jgi:hypothetical protein
MRKNVGTVDATLRITLGLLGLAYGIGKMSRKPHRTPWFLMTMSAMKVAEGITRFCPMLYAFGTNTVTKRGVNAVTGKETVQQTQETVGQTVSPRRSTELSPSDRQLESEIREYVTSRSPQGNNPAEKYKRDEHLYPTYS